MFKNDKSQLKSIDEILVGIKDMDNIKESLFKVRRIKDLKKALIILLLGYPLGIITFVIAAHLLFFECFSAFLISSISTFVCMTSIYTGVQVVFPLIKYRKTDPDLISFSIKELSLLDKDLISKEEEMNKDAQVVSKEQCEKIPSHLEHLENNNSYLENKDISFEFIENNEVIDVNLDTFDKVYEKKLSKNYKKY